MSPLLILTMALAAPTAEPAGAVSTTPLVEPAEQIQVPPPHELRRAAGDALRRQAVEKGEKQYAAVRDLVKLHKQLQADRRMAVGERERLQIKVRNRLLRFSRETSAAIVKAKAIRRAKARRARRAAGKPAEPPATVGLSDRARRILAQQIGGLAGGFGGPGGAGGAARGGMEDDGEELIELIQTVISPDHWDVNGGPGSIIYFGGLHVLIVRASDDVHDNLGGVLDKLREFAP